MKVQALNRFQLNRLQLKKHNDKRAAIVVGERGVHVVVIRMQGHHPHVLNCIFEPITDGVVPTLKKALKKVDTQSSEFTALLPFDMYRALVIDAPVVQEDEMKQAIRWQLKGAVESDVEKLLIDYIPLSQKRSGHEATDLLYVVAAEEGVVRRFVSLFNQSNCTLSVVDIPDMAQRNIAALFEEKTAALVFLHVGEHCTTLTITLNGELLSGRHIDVNWRQLANQNGAQEQTEQLVTEVKRALDYFSHQFYGVHLSKMMVAAPESSTLQQLLEEEISLSIERPDFKRYVDISAVPELLDHTFLCHAMPAIGTALRCEEGQV